MVDVFVAGESFLSINWGTISTFRFWQQESGINAISTMTTLQAQCSRCLLFRRVKDGLR